MIAKLTTGNGFGGAIRYDLRTGRGEKQKLAKVLDACGVSINYDEDGCMFVNPEQVAFDFRQQTMGYVGKVAIRKPVYHWALSYSPKDNVSEEDMVRDAKEFLKRIGFDDTQYVMTVHYDKKHHHLHIVTNIVNNQGKRIPTMGLVEKAHAAAAAITKENGYTWGEKTKKENIKANKMHKPHERAREIIEPKIREVLAKSMSFPDFQKTLLNDYEIMCNYTMAADGKRGRLSFCYEYEGQEHSFKASAVARDLSFGYVNKAIKENIKKAWKVKYEDVINGYNLVIVPIGKELASLRNNCFQLYKEVSDTRIAVKTETNEKYNQLKSFWKQFNEMYETGRNSRNIIDITEALGGMLTLLNPIAGLSVIFLAKIIGDIQESSQREQKKQLLSKIESIRGEITILKEKKDQLQIQKSERLRDYLDAKNCYQDYKDGLRTLDSRMSELHREIARSKAPKKAPVRRIY